MQTDFGTKLASKKGVSDEAEFASALSAHFHDLFLAVFFSTREKRQFITRLPPERALVVIILTVPIGVSRHNAAACPDHKHSRRRIGYASGSRHSSLGAQVTPDWVARADRSVCSCHLRLECWYSPHLACQFAFRMPSVIGALHSSQTPCAIAEQLTE